MKVISVLSQKGGAGKTTVATNIAVASSLKKKNSTVIIDLDPQASSAGWMDNRDSEDPLVISAQASRLSKILEKAEGAGGEIAIIDTAPHSEQSSLVAAQAADIIVIPCRPSIVDIRAIGSSVDIVDIAKKPAFVVLNQVPPRGSLTDEAREAIKLLNIDVCSISLGQRMDYIHAFTNSLGVMEYAPNSKAAAEVKSLFNFIMKKIK